MKVVLTVIVSYLLGCFSSAYFLGKMAKNIDIRDMAAVMLGPCFKGNGEEDRGLNIYFRYTKRV